MSAHVPAQPRDFSRAEKRAIVPVQCQPRGHYPPPRPQLVQAAGWDTAVVPWLDWSGQQ